MLIYTLKRFGVALLVLVTVSLVTFTLLRFSGDPAAAMAGESATEEDIEYVRKHYGFDKPLPLQYWAWATKALQGDFGRSVYLKRPVAQIVAEKAPITMLLGACSLLFALLLSIPLGVLAAMRPNTLTDRTALTIWTELQTQPRNRISATARSTPQTRSSTCLWKRCDFDTRLKERVQHEIQ